MIREKNSFRIFAPNFVFYNMVNKYYLVFKYNKIVQKKLFYNTMDIYIGNIIINVLAFIEVVIVI